MTWFSWEKIKGYTTTAVTKIVKVSTVQGLKRLGTNATKAIPFIGNAIGAIDDIYQDYKIGNLQEATSSLKVSQSLLQGQIKEAQTGLKEAKERELKIAQEMSAFNSQIKALQNKSNQSKAEQIANQKLVRELQLQSQAAQEAIKAQQLMQQQFQLAHQQLQASQEEITNRLNDTDQTLKILQDNSLSQAQKIASVKSIIEKEQQRINQFEQRLDGYETQLNDLSAEINQHAHAIDELQIEHQELENRVIENSTKISTIDNELASIKQVLQEQSFKQQQTEQKLETLLSYTRLKEQKQQLELELSEYLGIPNQLPQTTNNHTQQKLFDLNISEDISQENLIKYGNNYPIAAQVYDFYYNKFGATTMQGWIRCENGVFNKEPALEETINDLCQTLDLNHDNFSKEQILAKQALIAKLKANVEILNEISQLLNLESHQIDATLLTPATTPRETPAQTKNTQLPWLLIIMGLSFLYFTIKKSHHYVPRQYY